MERKIELIEFKPNPDMKYLVIFRGMSDSSSARHAAESLRGVFPDNTPIYCLKEDQNIEILPINKGDEIRIVPEMFEEGAKLLQELFPDNRVLNGKDV